MRTFIWTKDAIIVIRDASLLKTSSVLIHGMQPLNECNDKHTLMMELIKDMNRDDRIPALCCSFRKLQQCIVIKSKIICGQSSSQYWDETNQ
jgi:hypothetical protein